MRYSKLFLLTTVFSLFFSSVAFGHERKTEPVGYWSFDTSNGNSVVDYSGNEHHGKYVNGPTLEPGIRGNAVVFDGENDYIEIPDMDDWSVSTTGELTIEFWFKPAIDFRKNIINGYVHLLGKGYAGNQEWVFRLYQEAGIKKSRTSAYVFNLEGGYGVGTALPEVLIPNKWIYVVVTIDNRYISIYKNGHLYGKTDYTNWPWRDGSTLIISPGNGNAPIRIGTRQLDTYFRGMVDELKIYNRVLSEQEIQQSYENYIWSIIRRGDAYQFPYLIMR